MKVQKIINLESTFSKIDDNRNHNGYDFEYKNIKIPKGSGKIVEHIQGLFLLDDFETYIATKNSNNSKSTLIVFNERFNSYLEFKNPFNHPGGIDVVDNILVVGHEQYNSKKRREFTDKWKKRKIHSENDIRKFEKEQLATIQEKSSLIEFYDISNLKSIKRLKGFNLERKSDENSPQLASAVSILNTSKEIVLSIRNKNSLDFFTRSKNSNTWQYINSIYQWPKEINFNDFQSIKLFTDNKDRLYFVGLNQGLLQDKLILFKIKTRKSKAKYSKFISAELVNKKHFDHGESILGPHHRYGGFIKFLPYSNRIDSEGEFIVGSCSRNLNRKKLKVKLFVNQIPYYFQKFI